MNDTDNELQINLFILLISSNIVLEILFFEVFVANMNFKLLVNFFLNIYHAANRGRNMAPYPFPLVTPLIDSIYINIITNVSQ